LKPPQTPPVEALLNRTEASFSNIHYINKKPMIIIIIPANIHNLFSLSNKDVGFFTMVSFTTGVVVVFLLFIVFLKGEQDNI